MKLVPVQKKKDGTAKKNPLPVKQLIQMAIWFEQCATCFHGMLHNFDCPVRSQKRKALDDVDLNVIAKKLKIKIV